MTSDSIFNRCHGAASRSLCETVALDDWAGEADLEEVKDFLVVRSIRDGLSQLNLGEIPAVGALGLLDE